MGGSNERAAASAHRWLPSSIPWEPLARKRWNDQEGSLSSLQSGPSPKVH